MFEAGKTIDLLFVHWIFMFVLHGADCRIWNRSSWNEKRRIFFSHIMLIHFHFFFSGM
eukprot:UN21941